MTQLSSWRGHPVKWDEKRKEWLFCDTGEPAHTGYGKRPCVKCGRVFHGSNHGDADPCLGELPGVDNACCGHGNKDDSYIRFTNGVIVEGFTVAKESEKLRSEREVDALLAGHHTGWPAGRPFEDD